RRFHAAMLSCSVPRTPPAPAPQSSHAGPALSVLAHPFGSMFSLPQNGQGSRSVSAVMLLLPVRTAEAVDSHAVLYRLLVVRQPVDGVHSCDPDRATVRAPVKVNPLLPNLHLHAFGRNRLVAHVVGSFLKIHVHGSPYMTAPWIGYPTIANAASSARKPVTSSAPGAGWRGRRRSATSFRTTW